MTGQAIALRRLPCPFRGDRSDVGPAAIANAHRFIFDSRDRTTAERLELMNDADGVWLCRMVFSEVVKWSRAIEFVESPKSFGGGEGGYNEDHGYFG